LIEVAPQFRTGGYVIDFWGLGYQVAQRMGIESVIRDLGYRVQSIRSVARDGHTQASLGVDAFRRATDDRYTSLPRGDLSAAIYATIEEDVEAIFGDTIAGIDEHADGVSLTFANGTTRDFDLVIGADGLHSNVRRLVFGAESNVERYLGCRVAAVVFDAYRPRDELVYVTHSARGRSVGRFTLRDDRTLVLFVFRSNQPYVPVDLADRKALLRTVFGDVGWECPQMLAALDDVDDVYFDVVSQIRLARWSRGRTVLVGDAAACVSLLAGEGTGLAMTEAYVLAGELSCAGGDHRRAFDRYEARLRTFVEDKQAAAQKVISVLATKTRLGIGFRNFVMQAMDLIPRADLFLARSFTDDLALPDYPI
jgi:2-polyprenyl-6-methoxyphenol hydroxylase-like FAD-dependent oxidoreductase